jgi:predicted outer membrane repeat protein
MIFICLLLAGAIFTGARVSEAAVVVDSFDGLSKAINTKDAIINITADSINFTADKITIGHGVTISGPESRSTLNLNGKDGTSSFFEFSQGLKITLKNLNFTGGYNNDELDSDNGGGAIRLNSGTEATFENIAFSHSVAKSHGGTIYSWGTVGQKNTLTFRGPTAFENNESKGAGGAIVAVYSNLIFGGDATFRDNSAGDGGAAIVAVYSNLTFGGDVNFSGNSSSGDGGAIAANYSNLTFGGDATFRDNSSSGPGGAVAASCSDLTFVGKTIFADNGSADDSPSSLGGAIALNGNSKNNASSTFQSSAVFERNRANRGAAIYIQNNAKIAFNSGLRLINNSAGDADSGAIHMNGSAANRKATVTIVQNDPSNPTEIRGNTSGKDGHNAFYLQRHAELNFTLEKNDIYLQDAIDGDRDDNSNSVAINKGEGWFNVGRGGNIKDVDLANSGNFSLASTDATELNPKDFSSSGRIKFGIFPEDKKCAKIIANNITLGEGTILEIVAARGTYGAKKTYDIMISNDAIAAAENIIPISPQNINVEGKLSNDKKTYQIVIREKIIIDKNPPEMRLLSQLTNLDENQDNILDTLTDIYIANPGEENMKKLLDTLDKLSSREDQKTAISQLSPAFIADTINLSLIGDIDAKQMEIANGKNKIYLEPHLRRLDGILGGSEFGATLGASYRFEQLQFLTIGMQVSMHRNSLSGNYGSRASINSAGLAILASLENRLATLSLVLGYQRNSHSVDRSVEKLKETLHSEFFSNALSFSLELGKKFKIPSHSLELYPFLGIRAATLAHNDFSEGASGEKEYLALEIQGKRYTLLSSNFGLKLSATLGKFSPSLSLGGAYLIVSPGRMITANFKNYPDHRFQNEGADFRRFSPFLDLALVQSLPKNFSLSTNFSYSGNGSQRSMGMGFRVAKGF